MQQPSSNKKGFTRLRWFNRIALAAVAALALGVWTPNLTSASLIPETEPNNSGGTAQNNLNGNFTLDSDANITSSTTIPHVSIRATGDGATYDFYRFTSLGGTIILDIDDTSPGGISSDADTEIGIWDAAGNLIANNDDNSVDPGSVAGTGCIGSCNSFIQLGGQLPGDYIVGVCRFNCSFGSNFDITGNALTSEGFYTLHISTTPGESTVPTPEPSAMILLGSGLAGMGAYRRRNAKKS